MTAVDFITELAKTDTTNLKTDDTSDANIRYVGANPNNYIDIGDRDSEGNPILWRIIGVMNNITNLDNGEKVESLVKIIRAESIGEYSWDSSTPSVNNGWGVNEWSDSDIMKLLNPNTVYSGTPTIGGSLYWNRGSGSCYNDISEANIPCDFTSSGLSEEAKNKLAKVRWNTGTLEESNITSKITAKYMYEGERSNHNGKEQCKSAEEKYCNDEVERKTTWDGYIGLMYPSDYGYAVGGEVRETCLSKTMNSYNNDNCTENDWLTPSSGHSWTITSTPYPSYATIAFSIYFSGYIYIYHIHIAHNIIPVGYLKSSIKIANNPHSKKIYGSIDNPFVLQ